MSSSAAGENGSVLAQPSHTGSVSAVAVSDQQASGADPDAVRQQVLNSLERGDQKSLAGLLETGEWKIASNVVRVKPEDAQSVMNLLRIFSSAQQALDRAASSALGRPAKVQIVADEAAGNGHSAAAKPSTPQGSARSRAANDPIVKRVQEKFGAEIRTVIDHRNKQ
jgi:DNA polymerase-3 subunit gamma/tau